MSFVEGMCVCAVMELSVYGSVLPETHSWTVRSGLCSGVLVWITEMVRAGVGVGAGLVHGYIAAAIDAMLNYKEKWGFCCN